MTEEKIKNLKSKGWYSWKGEEGIIIDHAIDNIKACAESDDGKYFYPFSLLPDEDYEPLQTEDDTEAGSSGCGEEIVCTQIQNPGNEQKLSVFLFITETYSKDDVFCREILTETDSYYDWTSERTKFIKRYANAEKTEKEKAEKEWAELVKKYPTSCYDSPDFEGIWEKIDYLRQGN